MAKTSAYKGLTGNTRGITLIEILLFSSLSVAVFFWLAFWLPKPVKVQQKLQSTLAEQKALRATDAWVNDVKQMIPGSLSLDSSTGYGPLSFQIAGAAAPSGDPPGPPVPVLYSYQPEDSGPGGSLYRTVDGTSTVILSGLLAPDPSSPLFQNDPVLRILTVDLRLKGANGPVLRVVRRAALPN